VLELAMAAACRYDKPSVLSQSTDRIAYAHGHKRKSPLKLLVSDFHAQRGDRNGVNV